MDRRYHDPYAPTTPAAASRPSRPNHAPPSPTDARAGYARPRVQQVTGSEAEQSSRTYSSRPSTDRYDPRYHYPPPLSTSATSQSYRTPLRKRRSWPPQPCAEDEAVALRKEADSLLLLKRIGKDEVPSRGSIDQDPVIVDNPDFVNQHERRFVLKQSSQSSTGTLPTPPTSEDEQVRKARRRPSRLEINKNDQRVPEATDRTATPYAYTRPTKLSQQSSSSSHLTPPSSAASGGRGARLDGSGPKPSSPRRDSGRISPSTRQRRDYFTSDRSSNESAIDDSDNDRKPADAKSLRGSGKRLTELPLTESPRGSFTNLPNTMSSETAGMPSAHAPPIRRSALDARRNTDTQSTLPTMNKLNADKSRRPTPLMAATSLSEAQDMPSSFGSMRLDPKSAEAYPRSRESSYAQSRPVSREGSVANGAPPSPSRSPVASADYSKDARISREGSLLGSKPPSATSSRPTSPSPRTPGDAPRMPRTDLDWTALLAANAARRTKPPSRLSSAVPHDAAPTSAPLSAPPVDWPRKASPKELTPAQSSPSLPYPEDHSLMGSTMFMPTEQEYAYNPVKQNSFPPSSSSDVAKLSGTSTPASSSSAQSSLHPPRPSLNRMHSAAPSTSTTTTDMRAPEGRPRMTTSRQASFAESSQTKKEIAALSRKGLPACPRQEPVAGKDDWYTITGHTNIDFCPDCIDTLFERTVFRNAFRRSLPRSYSEKVRCAFGSPWIRLAWLLTLQQHRTDLTLLQDIADIEETSAPCPGGIQSVQNWYGLRDPDGLFVRDFHLCYGDVRKIECLLPTLSGIFVRLPQRASYTKSTCAIRMDSTRFSSYLDALVILHEKALAARRNADPMPLIDLVERKTRLRECTKDTLLIGALWHYIPDLAPAFTVCEDCFESVVEPEIKKNKSLAKKFNRTLQPVYSEGIGCSCQLYSPHMRKVFARAVEDNDMKYLVRKAKERREAEVYLQEKFKGVMTKAKRLSMEGTVTEDDERRLNRDLEKITKEWKERWE
ncbi:hypothetical protein CB0940_01829 [Cercospora beticola]|uniref:Uncharacterized protein n=1 Tax=Cercospora beticola TaxID=122368 RepID=A0A2G5IAB4_CERBT|nr:hypothetical protein CB0940_01829 [Cercospora beticola]PIB01423.1 hypothetical protein CB0940_01829 [Cercospora beticola]WPA97283.1 hypothetical protein RHO25_001892 [Cercospora beticola]